MKFVLDYSRLTFNQDGTRVADQPQIGTLQEKWFKIERLDIGPVLERARRMPDRQLPVYISGEDEESVSVSQVDLTLRAVGATFAGCFSRQYER